MSSWGGVFFSQGPFCLKLVSRIVNSTKGVCFSDALLTSQSTLHKTIHELRSSVYGYSSFPDAAACWEQWQLCVWRQILPQSNTPNRKQPSMSGLSICRASAYHASLRMA